MSAFDPLTEFFWDTAPGKARRVSRGGHTILEDGHYLTGIPYAAGLLSSAALVAGFVASFFRPGDLYTYFYTESALLVGTLLCLGFLGAHYGAMGWFGFVLGDVLTIDPRGSDQLELRFASAVAYAALLVAIVGFPVGIRRLLEAFKVLDAAPPVIVVPLATTAMGVLAFYAVSIWINSQQLIARMYFFYQGFGSATDASTLPLQNNAVTVARAAAIAAAVRTLVAAWVTCAPQLRERVEAVEEILVGQRDEPGLMDAVPQLVRSAGAVLLAVLLLGGVLQSFYNGLVMFSILLFFQLIRSGVIPFSFGPLTRFIGQLPALARVVLLFVIAQQITDRVPITGYTPLLWVTVSMLVLSTFLLPADPNQREAATPADPDPINQKDVSWFPGDYQDGVAPDGSRR